MAQDLSSELRDLITRANALSTRIDKMAAGVNVLEEAIAFTSEEFETVCTSIEERLPKDNSIDEFVVMPH